VAAIRFSDSATPTVDFCPKVGQSTHLLPVLQIHFRFDHDDFLHEFLRSISRHFGPFRALLKVLPVPELYFRATDLDWVHPVFLQKAFLAVCVRYGDNTGQNRAKKSPPGALEAKPEVEIWRTPVFRLSDPDFLFDFVLYFMGSISHRYGSTGREF